MDSEDPTSNSHSKTGGWPTPKVELIGAKGKPESPEKKVEKVISGEVVTKKKPVGTRIKELLFGDDAKSAAKYVLTDVALPAARNLIVEATTKGIERAVYGDSITTTSRRPPFGAMGMMGMNPGRFSYDSVSSPHGHRPPNTRPPLGARFDSGQRSAVRANANNIFLQSKTEGDNVLEHMSMLMDTYGAVSVADLNQLLGIDPIPGDHTSEKFGWMTLRGAHVRQTRDGWLLDIHPPEPI